jgi:hypothetical protein
MPMKVWKSFRGALSCKLRPLDGVRRMAFMRVQIAGGLLGLCVLGSGWVLYGSLTRQQLEAAEPAEVGPVSSGSARVLVGSTEPGSALPENSRRVEARRGYTMPPVKNCGYVLPPGSGQMAEDPTTARFMARQALMPYTPLDGAGAVTPVCFRRSGQVPGHAPVAEDVEVLPVIALKYRIPRASPKPATIEFLVAEQIGPREGTLVPASIELFFAEAMGLGEGDVAPAVIQVLFAEAIDPHAPNQLPGGIELTSAETLASGAGGLPGGIELISAEAMDQGEFGPVAGGIEPLSAEALGRGETAGKAGVISVVQPLP